jgi:hypothetical protein
MTDTEKNLLRPAVDAAFQAEVAKCFSANCENELRGDACETRAVEIALDVRAEFIVRYKLQPANGATTSTHPAETRHSDGG